MSDDGIQLHDPQTLYRRWEDGQWSPFTIDLTADAQQWAAMADADRSLIYWVLSSPRNRSRSAASTSSTESSATSALMPTALISARTRGSNASWFGQPSK